MLDGKKVQMWWNEDVSLPFNILHVVLAPDCWYDFNLKVWKALSKLYCVILFRLSTYSFSTSDVTSYITNSDA